MNAHKNTSQQVDRVSVPSPIAIDILMDTRHCVPSKISTAMRDETEIRSTQQAVLCAIHSFLSPL